MNFNESEILLKVFEDMFEKQKKEPLVIYGIGKNTKYLLDNLKGYNIIGLMDPDKTGEFVYGLPVLTKEDVINLTKTIVIVARRSVIKVIYERIKELENKNVTISNLLGVDFVDEGNLNKEIQENPYWKTSKEQLIKTLENYEAISFDVFDTLIARYVFKPENIFDIVEYKLNRDGIIVSFKKNRIKAQEEAINKFIHPTYEEIYLCFKKNLNISLIELEYIKKLEFDIERSLIYCRDDMIDILNFAVDSNKTIYLISDMYFSSYQIKELLRQAGIMHELPILVSSEYRKSKEDGGLYYEYKKLIKSQKCLHIGDNHEVDALKAKEYGIDTYHIKSGYELVMESGIYGIFKNSYDMDNAIIFGLWISKLFNSPFSLSKNKGIIKIVNEYEFGYFLCGIMILDFLKFIFKETKDKPNSTILFSARDGYLINSIYSRIKKNKKIENIAKNIYFLTSRRAITVASCYSWYDIEYMLKKSSMQCTQGEFIQIKFGILPDENDEEKDKFISTTADYEIIKKYLRKYKRKILNNAEIERNNYLKYIKTLKLSEHEELWVYDFVTSGTIFESLNKILRKNLNLICFAKNTNFEKKSYKEAVIKSYLGEQYLNVSKNKHIEYYLIWECILTAPTPQLEKFNKDGMPIYCNDYNRKKDFEYIYKIHHGIENFVMDFLNIKNDFPGENFDKNLGEEVISLIKSRYVEIDKRIQQNFEFENSYENIGSHLIWDSVVL